MEYRKELVAPMRGVEAANRVQYVLGKWRYRVSQSGVDGLEFDRSFPLSALFAVYPYQVHSKIKVRIWETPEGGCRVVLEQKIFKLGQPSSNLDKMVWKGDLDDVEASLAQRIEPSIDRIRQNAHAGKMTLVYIGFVFLLAIPAGIVTELSTHKILEGILASLITLFVLAACLSLIPFRMPDFPLENTVPTPPGGSNYPRSGRIDP